ncbi:MAG TPA: hypothetical protein VF713_23435, partial [Thermoanaerobaculia bacterium]
NERSREVNERSREVNERSREVDERSDEVNEPDREACNSEEANIALSVEQKRLPPLHSTFTIEHSTFNIPILT